MMAYQNVTPAFAYTQSLLTSKLPLISQSSVVETPHSFWFGERPYVVDGYMKISLPSGQLISKSFPSQATARPEKTNDIRKNVMLLSPH